MASLDNIPEWERAKNTVLMSLGQALYFARLIKDQLPESSKKFIEEMSQLERKISEAKKPFLTFEETHDYQNKFEEILLTWNPELETNLTDFSD